MKTESQKGWMLGIVTAVAASLCCITPILALISGVGGIAATFSWLEPARPYLIGITIAVLGFAWYQKLKPRKQTEVECDCEDEGKTNFWQSKTFLGIVTLFAIAALTFPSYSHVFYPKSDKQVVLVKDSALKTVDFSISGMTCTSCEEHVKHAVNVLNGVLESSANYEKGTASVKFDESKILVTKLVEAIDATGYKVEKYELQNSANMVVQASTFQEASSVNTIELQVKGMTCSGCEEHVKHAVNELDGVTEASVSYKDGKAIISYDASKTSPEKIKKAINSTGYKVVEPN